MAGPSACPAAQALVQAQLVNTADGHENAGPLSDLRGFLPLRDPARALPAPYRAWDETAAALPELTRCSQLRSALDALPVLHAGPGSLHGAARRPQRDHRDRPAARPAGRRSVLDRARGRRCTGRRGALQRRADA